MPTASPTSTAALYLSGLQPSLTERLRRTGTIDGPCVRSKRPRSSANRLRRPYLDAEAWLVKQPGVCERRG